MCWLFVVFCHMLSVVLVGVGGRCLLAVVVSRLLCIALSFDV